jgi:hypothetical protein
LRLPVPFPLVVLAGAALPLLACEHGIDLQGKVSVPAQVQQMFSAQHPGELVVTAQIPGQPDITAPSVILCEPAAVARVIDVKVLKLGCAREDTALISAWVVPRTANEVSCTAPPQHPRSADAPQSSDAVALGRAVAPVSIAAMDPSACKDGSITFAVTLAPR